ncbi:MAG: FkbM family methyltransferase [Acidobacteriota bacterium]|nr:FkbM family methyltransferase [Acidobacteriota bacterium]
MEFGPSDAFRREGWLERAGKPLRQPLAGWRVKVPLRRMYEAILDALPGDRLVARFPHGETVRLAAAYRQVVWNPQEYEALRCAVATGATVLDIGANLGGYTLLLAQWAGRAGCVHAFEPAPAARRGLIRHLDLNGLRHRVVVHAEAISAASGTSSFRALGIQGDNRLLADRTEHGIEVSTTSVDAFCRAHAVRPAVIKVDVEGAELDVLRGARETIASAGGRLALFVEMHPHLWAEFGCSRLELEAELRLQALRPERLDGGTDPWSLAGTCLRLRPCAS